MPSNTKLAQLFPYMSAMVRLLYRYRRPLVWVSGVLFLFGVLILGTAHGVNYYYRLKLERMFHEMWAFEKGEVSLKDVRAWGEKYGGKFSPKGKYVEFEFRSPLLNRNVVRFQEVFYWVGLRPWWFKAWIGVENQNIVSRYFSLFARHRNRVWIGGISEEVKTLPKFRNSSDYHYLPEMYTVGSVNLNFWTEGGTALKATITQEGPVLHKDRMKDFNFSCLTSLAGCAESCELVPGIAVDYQSYRQQKRPKEKYGFSLQCQKSVAKYLTDSLNYTHPN